MGCCRRKDDGKYVCSICGEEHGLDNIHQLEIKGQSKDICKECATTIKGLV